MVGRTFWSLLLLVSICRGESNYTNNTNITNNTSLEEEEAVTTNYRHILNKTDSNTKPSIDRTKEIILCEVEKTDETIYSSCDLKSINFTFFALFKPRLKRSLNFKNLLELRKSLANSSTCEIRYMKYNFVNERLEYVNSSVKSETFWYDGKLLNETVRPRVYIISDPNKKYRKTLVYECRLPRSDVYLSLRPMPSRYSHSHPAAGAAPNPVTVSGFHVKLNFVPLTGIDVNLLHNVNMQTTTTTTTRSNYLFYSEQNGHSRDDDEEDNKKLAGTKAIQRYMIFFDSKCRNCFINEDLVNRKEGEELLDATESKSIKCHLKPNSCVNEGKCYRDQEKSENGGEYQCNSALISPHAIVSTITCENNNGNCDMHQKCEYDEIFNKVTCLNLFQ